MRDVDREFIKRVIALGLLDADQGIEVQLAVELKRRQGIKRPIADLLPELAPIGREQLMALREAMPAATQAVSVPAAATAADSAEESIIDLDLLETDEERQVRLLRQSNSDLSPAELQARLQTAKNQGTTITDHREHTDLAKLRRDPASAASRSAHDATAASAMGAQTATRTMAAGDDDSESIGHLEDSPDGSTSMDLHGSTGDDASHAPGPRGATDLIRRERFERNEAGEIAMVCPRCNANFTVEMPTKGPGVETTGPGSARPITGQAARCPGCGYLMNLREVEDSGDFDHAEISAVTTATALESLSDPYIGKLIGRCLIKRKLGQGGMGTVYLGTHDVLDKDRAVKILPKNFARDKSTADRFIQEARTAARLEHKNILQVYDVGFQDEVYYIVMQFADGGSVSRLMRKHGRLRYSYAMRLVEQIAEGLACAHNAGIVHRDIKPDNIMMMTDGTVKVGDFGLAKSTGVGADTTAKGLIVGSPAYMSPEQCEGKAVDARSDIYSLGITFYHMVCGRRPFQGATPLAMMLMHQTETPKPPAEVEPDVPGYVSNLILRMIQKDPDDRFHTADELLVALQEAIRRHEIERPAKRGIKRPVEERLFGLFALREHLITREQMTELLQRSAEELERFGEPPRLGLLARRMGFLSLDGEKRIDDWVATARANGADPPTDLFERLVLEGGEIPASAFAGTASPAATEMYSIDNVLADAPQTADDYTPRVLDSGALDEARIQFEMLKADTRDLYKHDDEPAKAIDMAREFLARYARTTFGNDVREFFDQLVEKVAEAYDRLGLRLMQKNRLDEAIRKFAEAVRLNPDLAIAFNNRGIAQMRRGNFSAAIRDFQQAILIEPQAMFYYNRGQALRKLNKLAEAEESYNRCLDLDPTHDKAWCNRGGVRFSRKDFSGALADFEQALQANPTNAEALSGRAKIFLRQGEPERALTEFQRLVEVAPENARAHCSLAEVLLDLGRIDEAKRHLKTAVKLDAEQPDPLYNLAVIAARDGDGPRALALLRKSLKRGFQRFKRLKAETAFSILSDNPEFQQLLKGMRHR